jgi:hypothetical protein
MSESLLPGQRISSEYTFFIEPAIAKDLWNTSVEAAQAVRPWVGSAGEEGEARTQNLVRVATEVGRILPPDIRQAASSFHEHGGSNGAMLIRGFWLPDALLAVTPESRDFPDTIPTARAAGIMAIALAANIGPPISYVTNPDGGPAKIISSAAPQPTHLGTRTLASNHDTGWHREVLHTLDSPDSLVLFGIRSHPQAITGVIPAERIVEVLTLTDRELLSRPNFHMPEGLVPGSEQRLHPILAGTADKPIVNYAKRFAEELEAAADKDTKFALTRLARLLDKPDIATTHCLGSAECLLLKNDGLHRRTAFPYARRHPRWMLRVFAGPSHFRNRSPLVNPVLGY